jgi:hypothetical protein
MGRYGRISIRGAFVVLAWSALAQAAGKNAVAAQALYDEARQLVAAGKFEQACPKLKASYELDPGGGTLLNLADCYERQGRTAQAYATFKDALDVARRDGRGERVEFATQHLSDLEKRLSRLSVVVSDAARVSGLQVMVDGTSLDAAAYGVGLPLDPGSHVVRAEAPGKAPFEKSIEVPSASAKQLELEVPPLADQPAGSGAATVGAGSAPAGDTGGSQRTGPSTARTLGFVAGGLGIVSVGVGSFFGLRAFNRWDARNAACQGGCTPEAKTAGDDAQQAATISTVGFGVGVAALGAGLVLILTAPSSKEPSPQSAHVGKVQVGVLSGRDGAGLWLGSKW